MSEGPSTEITRHASARACLQCRRVKMRCCPVIGSPKCERCLRKSMDCAAYVQKKRGRKSLRPRQGDGDCLHVTSRNITSGQVSTIISPINTPGLPIATSTDQQQQQQQLARDADDVSSNFWTEVHGLQPSSLLNQKATKGRYSLQNILSIGSDREIDPVLSPSTLPEGDPILKGIISYHIATSLFEGFIRSFNPFVCFFDPSLHTFQYVRQQSPFLLAVILSVSAKAFNPALHLELHKYSEKLFTDAIAGGVKSPEIIQAIVLKTYWKQSDDTRSWPLIGYAIRLSMELGWHKLSLEDEDTTKMSPLEILKKRNIERTWLVLFVYDRSMSLQNGKPWMIERSEFIESVNIWYQSPLATTNDTVIAAFVSLRLIAADILEAFNPQRPTPSVTHPYRFDSLLKNLTPRVEAWRNRWLHIASEKERCHPFLVSFFSTHLLLLLYSFPLQDSISSTNDPPIADTEAFWITYNSALEMLRLVSHHSLSPLLSFAHDSIHIMTAYAAVFLIKLLLSIKNAARKQFEPVTLEAIDMAARVFDQQSTPPTFTCSLQAKFLGNAVQEYKRACKRQLARHAGDQESCASSYEQTIPIPIIPDNPETDGTMQDDNARGWMQRLEVNRFQTTSPYARGDEGLSSHPSALVTETGQNNDLGTVVDMTAVPNGAAAEEPSPPNWEFTGEDWESLFMNAGFDITDGAFIPL